MGRRCPVRTLASAPVWQHPLVGSAQTCPSLCWGWPAGSRHRSIAAVGPHTRLGSGGWVRGGRLQRAERGREPRPARCRLCLVGQDPDPCRGRRSGPGVDMGSGASTVGPLMLSTRPLTWIWRRFPGCSISRIQVVGAFQLRVSRLLRQPLALTLARTCSKQSATWALPRQTWRRRWSGFRS